MKQLFAALMVSLGLMASFGAYAAAPAGAINVFKGCEGQGQSAVCKEQKDNSLDPIIQVIVGTLIFAVASISVIMIIVGGIKYVVSNGDAGRIKSAKDTIQYAIVGLIVALLAYAIVNFVLKQFT